MICFLYVNYEVLFAGLSTEGYRLWGDKGGSLFLADMLLFSIGGLSSPLIVNAYIRVSSFPMNETKRNGTPFEKVQWASIDLQHFGDSHFSLEMTDISENTVSVNNTKTITSTVADIEYPYAIAASLLLFFALIFFVFFCLQIFTQVEKQIQNDHSKETAMDIWALLEKAKTKYSAFEIAHMICFAIFCFHTYGNENVIRGYLYSYAVESTYAFSPSEASALNTYFWIAAIVGRLGILIAESCCHFPTVVGIIVCIGLVNGLVLSLLASVNQTVLLIFIISFGIFNAPVFGGSVPFASYYVDMNAFKMSTRFFGAAVGSMCYQWLAGVLFGKFGPHSMMYILLGGSINILLMYIILIIVGNKWGKKKELRGDKHVEN